MSADAYEVVVVVDGSSDGHGRDAGPARTTVPILHRHPAAGGPSRPHATQVRARADGTDPRVHRRRRGGLAGVRGSRPPSPPRAGRHRVFGAIEHRIPANADSVGAHPSRKKLHRVRRAARDETAYVPGLLRADTSVSRETFDQVGGYAADLVRESDFEFASASNKPASSWSSCLMRLVADTARATGRDPC